MFIQLNLLFLTEEADIDYNTDLIIELWYHVIVKCQSFSLLSFVVTNSRKVNMFFFAKSYTIKKLYSSFYH